MPRLERSDDAASESPGRPNGTASISSIHGARRARIVQHGRYVVLGHDRRRYRYEHRERSTTTTPAGEVRPWSAESCPNAPTKPGASLRLPLQMACWAG